MAQGAGWNAGPSRADQAVPRNRTKNSESSSPLLVLLRLAEHLEAGALVLHVVLGAPAVVATEVAAAAAEEAGNEKQIIP